MRHSNPQMDDGLDTNPGNPPQPFKGLFKLLLCPAISRVLNPQSALSFNCKMPGPTIGIFTALFHVISSIRIIPSHDCHSFTSSYIFFTKKYNAGCFMRYN